MRCSFIYKENVKIKGRLVNLVVGIILLSLVLLAFSSYIDDEWYRQLAEVLIVAFSVLLIYMTIKNGHDEYLYHIIDGEFIVRLVGKDDVSKLLCEVDGKDIAHIFLARDAKSEKHVFFHTGDYSEKFAISKKYALLVNTDKGMEKIIISPSAKTLSLLIDICDGEVHFDFENETGKL